MIKRRTLATVGALVAGALALSGCASGSTGDSGKTGATAAEKTELRMLVNVTPNLTEDWWNKLVAPFEKDNPGIDVTIQSPGADTVAATVPRLLASGDVPDIVQSMAPSTALAPELVDLSKYKWASDGPLADPYSIGDKYYMAGIGVQLQTLMFYNKKAFTEAGIDAPPETLEELDADLAKLKDAGWTPIQTGGDWMSSMTLTSISAPSAIAEHPKWFSKMSSGKLTFSDTYGDAVTRYADWVAKGYIPKDALGVKYADAEQNFLAGKSAIYPMGSWFAGSEAKTKSTDEIGVFRAPPAKGIDDPAMGANIASPYILMKASKHQDAAAKLVEYLTTDKDAVVKQLQVDSNFRDGYEYKMDALGQELTKIVAATSATDYTPTGQGYGEHTLPGGYSIEVNAQTQALMGGTAASDVRTAMDNWFAANLIN